MANDAVGKNIIQKPNMHPFLSKSHCVACHPARWFVLHRVTVSCKEPILPRDFSLGTLGLPSPQKPTFPNSNAIRNQVDEEPLCGCATSKSLFIYLFIFNIPSVCILNRNPYDFSDSDSDFDEEEDDKKTKKKKKKKVSRRDGFGCCFRFFPVFFF